MYMNTELISTSICLCCSVWKAGPPPHCPARDTPNGGKISTHAEDIMAGHFSGWRQKLGRGIRQEGGRGMLPKATVYPNNSKKGGKMRCQQDGQSG